MKAKQMPKDDLPEFESPPLAEVVLGIQFDPLENMRAVHLGVLWSEFRSDFPLTEDQAPLPPVFERFPRDATAGGGMGLEFLARQRLPRTWFVNEAGDELLQFQDDRFLHNWRRVDGQTTYPRYPNLRQRFAAEVTKLSEFAAAEKLGTLTPNQCEITYINHVVADDNWSNHHQAGTVFGQMTGVGMGVLGAKPEHMALESAFVIEDDSGEPRGRLHAAVVSGVLKQGAQPMFAMTLTARGAPLGNGLDGVLQFLDLGHRWIVQGFADLTTEKMHKVWGRVR